MDWSRKIQRVNDPALLKILDSWKKAHSSKRLLTPFISLSYPTDCDFWKDGPCLLKCYRQRAVDNNCYSYKDFDIISMISYHFTNSKTFVTGVTIYLAAYRFFFPMCILTLYFKI